MFAAFHRPLGVSCSDNAVNLVDDEYDVAQFLDFLNEALHPAFKLAAKLRPRYQSG
jgi:hypothetical protein